MSEIDDLTGALHELSMVRFDLMAKLKQLKDVGTDLRVIRKTEKTLGAATLKMGELKVAVNDAARLLELETERMKLAPFPAGNRDEAKRLMEERDEAIRKVRLVAPGGRVMKNAAEQLRILTEMYVKPPSAHAEGRLAELEARLEVLKVEMAGFDQSIAKGKSRRRAIFEKYQARLDALTEDGSGDNRA